MTKKCTLSRKSCTPCKGGVAPLALEDSQKLLQGLGGWSLSDDGSAITRRYPFKNFALAMEFGCKVGEVADAEGHHPVLTIGWGFCAVTFKTIKINGLHENDFIMAAKVNEVFDQPEGFHF
jgi:4a-hydroxytetrahydrobiopterin dehydratase